MSLKAGDAFQMRPDERFDYHLYVVLLDPSTTGEVVIINFTSDPKGSYTRGCGHDFIDHPSKLVFAETDTPKEDNIMKSIRRQNAFLDGSVSPALLLRIKEDCKASPLFPTYLKRRL